MLFPRNPNYKRSVVTIQYMLFVHIRSLLSGFEHHNQSAGIFLKLFPFYLMTLEGRVLCE